MNRHALVAAASSAVIAGSAAYALLGAAALSDVQFRWGDPDGFGYVALASGGLVEVCNPSPLPVRLDRLEIGVAYQGGEFASFGAPGGIIGPGESALLRGDGEARGAGIFSGYGGPGGFDEGDIEAGSTARTLVFGLIPHSVTREYSGSEFAEMMEGRDPGYAC